MTRQYRLRLYDIDAGHVYAARACLKHTKLQPLPGGLLLMTHMQASLFSWFLLILVHFPRITFKVARA
jgi:hypothetical protein